MSLKHHGISIGIQRTAHNNELSEVFLTLKATGTLNMMTA